MKKITISFLFPLVIFSSVVADSRHVQTLGAAIANTARRIFVEYPYVYAGPWIFDIGDPFRPSLKGSIEDSILGSLVWAKDIQVKNRRIYTTVMDYGVNSQNGLLIADFVNDNCEIRSFLPVSDSSDYVSGLYVKDSFTYVTSRDSGLHIINVSNPQSPVQRGCFKTDGYAMGVFVVGNLAYVADDYNGLCIIDVSDPSQPRQIGHYKTNSYATNLCVLDTLAYVADMWDGLRIISVADPTHPYEVGYYDTPGSARNVWVLKNLAYVADNSKGLRIIDVSNPVKPVEVGWFGKGDTVMFYDVCASDTLIYTIGGQYPYGDSLFILQFSETGVKETDNLAKSRYPLLSAFPNPARDFININFQIMKSGWVSMKIYDNCGQLVRILLDENIKSANHSIIWNGKDNSGRRAASGVYFCRLQTDEFTAVRRLVLLR